MTLEKRLFLCLLLLLVSTTAARGDDRADIPTPLMAIENQITTLIRKIDPLGTAFVQPDGVVIVTRKKSLPEDVLRGVRELAADFEIESAVRVESVLTNETAVDSGRVPESPIRDKRSAWKRFTENRFSWPTALVFALVGLALLFELSLALWSRLKARDTETSASTSRNDLSTLPAEGALALLADCYWSKADSYAAFVWRRLSLPVRKSIVADASWLATYAASLTGVIEEDLGADQEPYYQDPLSIWHLDNKALSALVSKVPALYSKLPTLRTKELRLG